MPTTPDSLPAPRERRGRGAWMVMIILTTGYVGLFVFSVLGAITSPLVFDSGDTARNWWAFAGLLAYPFFIAASLALAWIGFRFRRTGWSVIGFILPVAYAVVFWRVFS